jgi:hypothetical protein
VSANDTSGAGMAGIAGMETGGYYILTGHTGHVVTGDDTANNPLYNTRHTTQQLASYTINSDMHITINTRPAPLYVIPHTMWAGVSFLKNLQQFLKVM